jgi:hypothetical protein
MLFIILFWSICFGAFWCNLLKKDEYRLKTTENWCDASEIFTDWRLRNPGVYLGLSEEGRKLLSKNLETYDEFLRTHPYINGTKHREWLVSLFYEFPPKSPDDAPVDEGEEDIELAA